MITHNQTPWDVRQILDQFAYLGYMKNLWRQRDVCLYAHPTAPDHLVTIGMSFDSAMRVIVVEPRAKYTTALAYIARGKVYIVH